MCQVCDGTSQKRTYFPNVFLKNESDNYLSYFLYDFNTEMTKHLQIDEIDVYNKHTYFHTQIIEKKDRMSSIVLDKDNKNIPSHDISVEVIRWLSGNLKMSTKKVVGFGKTVSINCLCDGYPLCKSELTFTFTPCSLGIRLCSTETSFRESNISITTTEHVVGKISTVNFMAFGSGFLTCQISNFYDTKSITSIIRVEDDEQIKIWLNNEIVTAGDSVTMVCGILTFELKEKFDWYRNNILLVNNTERGVTITEEKINYLLTKTLLFNRIAIDDSGEYECRGILLIRNYPINTFRTIQVNKKTQNESPLVWIIGALSVSLAVLLIGFAYSYIYKKVFIEFFKFMSHFPSKKSLSDFSKNGSLLKQQCY